MIDYTIKHLEIEITTYCNLKCPLCFHNSLNQSCRNVNIDSLITKLNEFKSLESVTIAGSSGEPTLHNGLFKLIAYLNKREIGIELFTNAETKNELYFRKLSLLLSMGKRNKIVFSVFGTSNKLHSVYRIGSTLERVLHIHDICSKKVKCEIFWIVFDYNFEDYKKNKGFFGNRKVHALLTLPFNEIIYNKNNKFSLPKEFQSCLKELTRVPANCSSKEKQCAILDVNLDIFPCSIFKFFKDKYCWMCNEQNIKMLDRYKVNSLPEFSGGLFLDE